MPLDVERKDGASILWIRATGPGDVEEWKHFVRQYRAVLDPRQAGLVMDVRERDSIPTGEQVRTVGEILGSWKAVAILARPGAQYGTARIHQAAMDMTGPPTRAFTDPDEAEGWVREQIGSAPEPG